MVTVVIWQMAVGIANVLFFTPPLITVIHLASGMALLGLTVRQLFLVRTSLTAPELNVQFQTPVKPVGASG